MQTQNKKHIPLYCLFLVFLGSIFTGLTYVILPSFRVQLGSKFPTGFIVYGICISLAVAIVVALIKIRGWKMRDIGFKKPSRKMILMGVLCVPLAVFVIYPMSMLINKALGVQMRGMDFTINSFGDAMVAIFICAVIIPMVEEILFRGFLIKVAQQKIKNRWLVGALAIFCFSLVHIPYFGIGGMIFITFWAVIPVSLFIYYDNIYPSYVMHALNNLSAYFIIPFLLRG